MNNQTLGTALLVIGVIVTAISTLLAIPKLRDAKRNGEKGAVLLRILMPVITLDMLGCALIAGGAILRTLS